MAKFLLLLALGIVVYLIVSRMRREGQRSTTSRDAPPKSSLPEDMVRCAVCKVHLPRSESFVSRGEYYCSDEHLKLAKGGAERH